MRIQLDMDDSSLMEEIAPIITRALEEEMDNMDISDMVESAIDDAVRYHDFSDKIEEEIDGIDWDQVVKAVFSGHGTAKEILYEIKISNEEIGELKDELKGLKGELAQLKRNPILRWFGRFSK